MTRLDACSSPTTLDAGRSLTIARTSSAYTCYTFIPTIFSLCLHLNPVTTHVHPACPLSALCYVAILLALQGRVSARLTVCTWTNGVSGMCARALVFCVPCFRGSRSRHKMLHAVQIGLKLYVSRALVLAE
jgi:hypothetical protein